MTSKKLTQQTIEQLEASSKALLASYEEFNRVAEEAAKKRNLARERLRKVQLEIESRNEMTLEKALETYIASGENSRGSKWLDEKTYKGDWKGTGFGFYGSCWIHTNQRVLAVRSNHKWSEAELAVQEATILSVIDVVKTGHVEKSTMIKLSKDEEVDLKACKVLDIRDRGLCEHYNWRLAKTEDGRWFIYDEYRAKHWNVLDARKVGTLKECLEEIRNYLYAEGGQENEYGEDDD
jgi:hypothetical protein